MFGLRFGLGRFDTSRFGVTSGTQPASPLLSTVFSVVTPLSPVYSTVTPYVVPPPPVVSAAGSAAIFLNFFPGAPFRGRF